MVYKPAEGCLVFLGTWVDHIMDSPSPLLTAAGVLNNCFC